MDPTEGRGMAKEGLEIKNLKVRNGNFELKVDDLFITKGKILCLMGPNGSGKTTLLKAISRLVPYDGEIKYMEKEFSLLDTRRQIGYVSQNPNLFKGNIFQNIAYPLKIRNKNKSLIKDAVEKISRKLGIEELLPKNSYQVSGGEARKVSLARALVYNPNILLLDEPLNNLDRASSKTIKNDIKNILNENITAVYASHSNEEAIIFGNEMVFLNNGKVIQKGKVEEVISFPASKTVADHLGTQNIYETEVTGWSRGLAEVEIGSIKAYVSSGIKRGKVHLCINPSDVFLATESLEKFSARNSYLGKIKKIEDLARVFNIKIDCGFVINAYVTKQSVEEMDLRKSGLVNVYFKATAVHLIRR